MQSPRPTRSTDRYTEADRGQGIPRHCREAGGEGGTVHGHWCCLPPCSLRLNRQRLPFCSPAHGIQQVTVPVEKIVEDVTYKTVTSPTRLHHPAFALAQLR